LREIKMMSEPEPLLRRCGLNLRPSASDRPATNIPTEELSMLMIAIADAFHVAAQGNVSAGYRTLCDGLFRTRDSDDAWSPDVTQLWSLALAHFIKRHPASWFSPDA
jgi:hypothetical protein